MFYHNNNNMCYFLLIKPTQTSCVSRFDHCQDYHNDAVPNAAVTSRIDDKNLL